MHVRNERPSDTEPTNVIIYAYDVSAGERREKAEKILVDLWGSGQGLLSIQVLQEFFVSVTRKIPPPLALKAAKQIINDLLTWEIVVKVTPSGIR